jgi:hypothetical protein
VGRDPAWLAPMKWKNKGLGWVQPLEFCDFNVNTTAMF